MRSSRLWKGLAAVLLAVVLTACPREDEPRPVGVVTADQFNQAMQQLAQQYEQAFNRRDAAALAQLFTSDAHLLQPAEPPIQGQGAIQQRFEQEFRTGVTQQMQIRTGAAGFDAQWGWADGQVIITVSGAPGAPQPPGTQPPATQPPGAQPPGAQPPGAQPQPPAAQQPPAQQQTMDATYLIVVRRANGADPPAAGQQPPPAGQQPPPTGQQPATAPQWLIHRLMWSPDSPDMPLGTPGVAPGTLPLPQEQPAPPG